MYGFPSGPQPVRIVARWLDLSVRSVQNLARRGVIPRAERGRYDLPVCLRSYLEHLRERAAARSGRSLDLVGERARLAAELADGWSLKNERARAQLIPAVDVSEVDRAVRAAVRQRMLEVPAEVGARVAGESEPRACERILREHIEAALREIADAEVVVRLEKGARRWRAPAAT